MIVRLTGKVDGRDVIFSRASGDVWETIVPYDLDGMYVIEVTGINDRGLIAYCTKMLLIVDPSKLSISLVPYDYFVAVVDTEYSVEVVFPKRQGNAMEVKYILGEDKRIRLLVRSPNNEPFTVLEAHYKLMLKNTVETEGNCEIDGHYLDIKLSPAKKSLYTLEVTYKVADSTRKAMVWVMVI